MPKIELKNLTVSYEKKQEDTPVLRNLSAVFPTGKISLILGNSGSGKTTLLKTIAGLLKSDGQILFDDIDVSLLPTEKRDLAYVSQEHWLYPYLTVFDNIAYPLKAAGGKREEVTARVKDIADKLSLTILLDRKPRQLSLGQQQRVALAKALARHPSLILFDEPLSSLDAPSRQAGRLLIKDIVHRYSLTAIYVTHDLTEAEEIGEVFYHLQDGHFDQTGSKDKVLSPFFSEGNPQ
jgi:multiple sugar transport system ATP-binding protein